jgi:branched-chain amino acid transport system permease protein
MSHMGPETKPAALLLRILIWPVVIAVLLALPHVLTSAPALALLCLMGSAVVLALSYNVLLGQTGLLSLGHAVFYGLGSFVAAHTMNAAIKAGWPLPLPVIPLVAGLACWVMALVVGWISTRAGSAVFVMASLVICELVAGLLWLLPGISGGTSGIITSRSQLFVINGWRFERPDEIYYLILAWCLVSALLLYGLTRTPFGRLCNAVRDNPERAELVGINLHTVRAMAVGFAGLFAGVAGGLAAINLDMAHAASFNARQSAIVLFAVVIGGSGHFLGPVIGAGLVVALQAGLSGATDAGLLMLGLLFLAVTVFQPAGIAGLMLRFKPAGAGQPTANDTPSSPQPATARTSAGATT